MGDQILVVTHNGQLPSNGGKRIGYQTGNMFFPLGSTEPVVLSDPEEERKKSLPLFGEFNRLDIYRECPHCCRYVSVTKATMKETADQGWVSGFQCSGCEVFLLPLLDLVGKRGGEFNG